MKFKKVLYQFIFSLFLLTNAASSLASTCNSKKCDGYILPESASDFISQGYSNVSVQLISGYKYLLLTTLNDVNKCSVLFKVNENSVDSTPLIGTKGQICNISTRDGKVVSSWRDAGKWNDDVYQVSPDGGWNLLFRDSCVGCDQIKRSYFTNGKEIGSVLMSDGDNFTLRKNLTGKIIVDKSILYKSSNINGGSKGYLIKGDIVSLIDMSGDGGFYKVKYKAESGKVITDWIKSDDFSLN